MGRVKLHVWLNHLTKRTPELGPFLFTIGGSGANPSGKCWCFSFLSFLILPPIRPRLWFLGALHFLFLFGWFSFAFINFPPGALRFLWLFLFLWLYLFFRLLIMFGNLVTFNFILIFLISVCTLPCCFCFLCICLLAFPPSFWVSLSSTLPSTSTSTSTLPLTMFVCFFRIIHPKTKLSTAKNLSHWKNLHPTSGMGDKLK